MGVKYSSVDVEILSGHRGAVNSVVQLNGIEIASCSSDTSINVWNLQTGLVEMELTGYLAGVTCIVLMKDGRLASGTVEKVIKIWTLDNHRCDFVIMAHDSPVTCLIQLKDGSLCSGSADTKIKVWDIHSMWFKYILEGHTKAVKCLAELNDKRLASGSEDGTLRIWRIRDKKTDQVVKMGSTIYSLLVLSNGNLCVGLKHKIKVMEIAEEDGTSKVLYKLKGHHSSVNCMINLSPDSCFIGSGGGGSIKIWNLKTKSCEYSLEAHKGGVNGLMIMEDKRLVSCGGDKLIKIWSLEKESQKDQKEPVKASEVSKTSGAQLNKPQKDNKKNTTNSLKDPPSVKESIKFAEKNGVTQNISHSQKPTKPEIQKVTQTKHQLNSVNNKVVQPKEDLKKNVGTQSNINKMVSIFEKKNC